MRYLLTLIFAFCGLFASAQVTISDDVADYYLELYDRAAVYQKQLANKDIVIESLNKQLITKQLEIETFSLDSTIFRNYLATKNDHLAFNREELALSRKEVRKQKFQKIVVIVVAGIIIIVEVIIPKVKVL